MNDYRCKICDSDKSNYSFTKQVLYKYSVEYFKCSNCGFIQTEKPYWLEESYSSVIAKLDIGLIYRTMQWHPVVSYIIKFLFSKQEKRYLDYGGGYGIFTRIMRDKGYNFYNHDPYCQNIFSTDFNLDLRAANRYELLTSFEVFEHLEFPVEEVKKMLEYSDSILFTTELQPLSSIESWWYLSPETGQHISFYSQESLSRLANKLGCFFFTSGGIHLITKKKINKNLFMLINHPRLGNFFRAAIVFRKKTFLQTDYEKLKSELSNIDTNKKEQSIC